MKRIVFCFFVFLSLQGCFSINEEIYLHDNNSGEYSIEMDLSQAISMVQSLAASFADSLNVDNEEMEDIDENSSSKDADTTIYLKPYIDTSTTLSDEEKRILGKSRLTVKGGSDMSAFKMKLTVPFDNLQELHTLSLANNNGSAFELMFSALGSKNPNLPVDKSMSDAKSPYELEFSDNVFERKFSEELFKSTGKNMVNEMQDEESLEMLGDASYNTTLHFDKPVKNITGKYAKLSDDRKTVIINVLMKDFIKNPSSLAYKVEF